MADAQDDLDQRLQERGARWRAGQPLAAAVDLQRLRSAPRPTRGLAPSAIAAAVAAVLVTVLVGIHVVGADGRGPTEPTAVRPGQVVPWRPLPATHPHIPTASRPAERNPAVAPACHVDDLRPTTPGPGAAGGTVYLRLTLSLIGDRPCRLQGYPTIRPHSPAGAEQIPVERAHDSSVYRRPVLVEPGSPATLQLSWGGEWCDPPTRNDRLQLTLPAGGGTFTVAGFGRSSIVCDHPSATGPTPITTRTFEPLDFPPVEKHSPYDDVRVSGDLDLTARANGTVRFTVTLTSRRRVVLDPCPDFSVTQGQPEPPSVAQRFALNCAGVPYRDADGRPYLPAGVPVRFAIESDAGAPGARSIRWLLDVPHSPGVFGAITVRRAPAG